MKKEAENIELLEKYIRDKEAQMVIAFNKEDLIKSINQARFSIKLYLDKTRPIR